MCIFQAYYDMDTDDGGGWMVIQTERRMEDLYHGWADYVEGFGDLNRELTFWLGQLNNIYSLMLVPQPGRLC